MVLSKVSCLMAAGTAPDSWFLCRYLNTPHTAEHGKNSTAQHSTAQHSLVSTAHHGKHSTCIAHVCRAQHSSITAQGSMCTSHAEHSTQITTREGVQYMITRLVSCPMAAGTPPESWLPFRSLHGAVVQGGGGGGEGHAHYEMC
jgi:hypothetical protein